MMMILEVGKNAPLNNFLQSLFKKVDVSLNGIQETQSTATYCYRSYFETLLNVGPASKSSQLTAGLYYKVPSQNFHNFPQHI